MKIWILLYDYLPMITCYLILTNKNDNDIIHFDNNPCHFDNNFRHTEVCV